MCAKAWGNTYKFICFVQDFLQLCMCNCARPKVCTGAGRRVTTDDMLVAVRQARGLHDYSGEAPMHPPIIAGRSGTEAGPMILSKLADHYHALKDADFTVWKPEGAPSYYLKGVTTTDLTGRGTQIVDELVKCLAFSSRHALQIAPSQEEALESMRQLKLQGYVEEAPTGWYLTEAGKNRIDFSRSLGSPGQKHCCAYLKASSNYSVVEVFSWKS